MRKFYERYQSIAKEYAATKRADLQEVLANWLECYDLKGASDAQLEIESVIRWDWVLSECPNFQY